MKKPRHAGAFCWVPVARIEWKSLLAFAHFVTDQSTCGRTAHGAQRAAEHRIADNTTGDSADTVSTRARDMVAALKAAMK